MDVYQPGRRRQPTKGLSLSKPATGSNRISGLPMKASAARWPRPSVPASGVQGNSRADTQGRDLGRLQAGPSRSRSIDVLQTVRHLGERGIKVVVLQLGNTDLTAPAGKLLLSMLAALAEMERDLLVECTQAGLARAKAKGKALGRPSKTTSAERLEIQHRLGAGESVSAVARTYGVSRATVGMIRKLDLQSSN